VGLRAGLDGCGKSRLCQDSIPGPTISSESLYQLRYPGDVLVYSVVKSVQGKQVVWRLVGLFQDVAATGKHVGSGHEGAVAVGASSDDLGGNRT
jgi:hypothetical protein